MKSTLLAGAGALVTGNTISATLSNAGRVAEVLPKNGGSAILTKKRTLGSGKAALKVSALSLGCMGMQGGPGITPDEKRMEKFIRQAYERGSTSRIKRLYTACRIDYFHFPAYLPYLLIVNYGNA